MDGWITIGTKLDTSDLEKDLRNAERELKKFEKEEQSLLQKKAKLEIDTSNSEKKLDVFNNKVEALYQKLEKERVELSNIPQWKQGTPEYDKQVQKVNEIALRYKEIQVNHASLLSRYNLQSNKLTEINNKLKQNATNQSLISSRIAETTDKLQNTKAYGAVSSQLNKIGDKTSNVIKKVGKWALAVFSVRSAYMFLQRASSTLAQYDEQYASNLEYIRFALAQMVAPILKYIVDLAYRLLTYINLIANAWFGVNLFANASTKAFEKANKSLGGSVSKAKELNKQLTGFDEMNVLQENGSTKSGGGGGGFTMPSTDLSSMDVEVPEWLQWVLDNGPTVMNILGGVIGIITAAKFINALKTIKGVLDSKNLGIILGLLVALQGIVGYVEDLEQPTVNVQKAMGHVLLIVGGIGLAVTLIAGLIPALVAALIAAIGVLIYTLVTKWDEFVAGLGVIKDAFIKVWESAKQGFMDHIWTPIKNFFLSIWEWLIKVKDSFVTVWNSAKQGFIDNIWTPIKNFFLSIWEWIKSVGNSFVTVWQSAKDGWNKYIVTPIKNTINNIKTWVSNIGSAFSKVWESAKKGASSAAKAVVNYFIDKINSMIGKINSLIKSLNKIQIGGIGINIPTIGKIPRLASGGIVNLPGKGVYANGTIRGEAGAEGVLPLTDTQTMERLGETIGRYITINANITNTMNGRTISRIMKQIQGEQDFAYNT